VPLYSTRRRGAELPRDAACAASGGPDRGPVSTATEAELRRLRMAARTTPGSGLAARVASARARRRQIIKHPGIGASET